jgi:hypothetical protein
MSDIIKARTIIESLMLLGLVKDRAVKRQLKRALKLMRREPPIRHTKKSKRVPITPKLRSKIRHLAATDMSIHDIANAVGLHNSGRISELLNGKR